MTTREKKVCRAIASAIVLSCDCACAAGALFWGAIKAAIILACMLAPAIYGYILDNL
ncbi:MAG: hypothetical protein LUE08_07130 [Akkermansiaceae bacterium]|nr:hypothetical protein [Akkermansiaceae bacterium]